MPKMQHGHALKPQMCFYWNVQCRLLR